MQKFYGLRAGRVTIWQMGFHTGAFDCAPRDVAHDRAR